MFHFTLKSTLYTVFELIAGIVFSSVAWPCIFFGYVVNKSLRAIVTRALNYMYGDKYTIANGEDSIFGTRIYNNCGSLIVGYEVFDGKGNVEIVRDRFHKLLTDTNGKYDRLTQAFVSKYGYFCWEKKNKIDLTRHIRHMDYFGDVSRKIIDEDELHETMEKISTSPLSTERPQWEILMIPNFRMKQDQDENQENYALVFRLHHSYCDGVSFLLMSNNYLADKPGGLPIDPSKPLPSPLWATVFVWIKVVIFGPMYFIMNMASFVFLDMSGYKVPRYSERKLYARSPLFQMETLKALRKKSGASITAILMSSTYAAMFRAHLKAFKGRKVPKYLINGNVAAMLPYKDDTLCNRFTLFPLSAPFSEIEPKERLKQMIEITNENLFSPNPIFDFYVQRGLGSLPAFIHQILFGLSGSPLMLSNVPGYTTHVEVFGSKMVDVAAWLPLVCTTGIGIATQSYCGTMRLCGIVDSKVFSSRCHLQELLDDIVHEIDVLSKIYQIDTTTESTVLITCNNKTDTVRVDKNNNNYDNDSNLTTLAKRMNARNEDEEDIPLRNDNTRAERRIEVMKRDVNSTTEDIRRRMVGKSIQ